MINLKNTVWNQSEWTGAAKAKWQKLMFKIGYTWSTSGRETEVHNMDKDVFMICPEGIMYFGEDTTLELACYRHCGSDDLYKIVCPEEPAFKVGDNVWTVQAGWTKVTEIFECTNYVIGTYFGQYSAEGKMHAQDVHPSLFKYDPLNGTEPPAEFRIGSFYKMRCSANGTWFVAEWRGAVFEMGGYHYELCEVSDIVLMKEA